MYAWIEDRNIGDVRIWREKRRSNFDENDLHILELVYPAFVISLQRARIRTADHMTESEIGREYSAASMLLTGRELRIVKLAAQGLLDKQIAGLLGIGLTTVRTHLRSAFRKLGVNNRVKLCRLFAHEGAADHRLN
jgi:DNA-binding CsgD family transcriptional regulator